MTAFDKIRAAALKRLGGEVELAARLPRVSTAAELRAAPDDRYLSLMSRRIFRAGLKHSLVDARWPAFEEAFRGFDLRRVTSMNDEDIEALMNDRRLIRHWGKIKSVRSNAAAMHRIGTERGSFGTYLADWPGSEVVGLWDDLAKRFQQMGGNSGPSFLRMAGKDTFILTHSVIAGLDHWRAFAGTPKSKTARAQVQAVFNEWAAATGSPLAHLSMTLALSVD
ncbi:MAG TPA: DNA-3-methyladenine glycosylase I [Methylomirabilota bacterium]|nr:DNA-3-methyladenine glycosylase I [Methylomirabilota bacterium]